MKKLLSVILSLALVACMMPTMAFAASTDENISVITVNGKVNVATDEQGNFTVTGKDDAVLEEIFNNLAGFDGTAVSGTIAGKAYKLDVVKESNLVKGTGGEGYSEAWQELAKLVEAVSDDTNKTSIVEGTYIQLGDVRVTVLENNMTKIEKGVAENDRNAEVYFPKGVYYNAGVAVTVKEDLWFKSDLALDARSLISEGILSTGEMTAKDLKAFTNAAIKGIGKELTFDIVVEPSCDAETKVSLSTKGLKKGIKVTVTVPEEDVAGMDGVIIYRAKGSKDNPYKAFKTFESAKETYRLTNLLDAAGNPLAEGKTYYYYARAYKVIDGKTYYGPKSSIKSARAAVECADVKVKLNTTTVPKGIKVVAEVASKDKAKKDGVEIYRAYKNGKFEAYKKVKVTRERYIITNLYDKYGNDLREKNSYSYKARTYRVIDGKTYYGEWSDVVSAVAPVAKVKADITLTTKGISKGIKFTVKCDNADKNYKTGFIVYRSTSKNAKYYYKYKTIKTSKASYTFTNTANAKGKRLTKGKTYYYKVRTYKVINGKTYYGDMSSIKSIKAV